MRSHMLTQSVCVLEDTSAFLANNWLLLWLLLLHNLVLLVAVVVELLMPDEMFLVQKFLATLEANMPRCQALVSIVLNGGAERHSTPFALVRTWNGRFM